MRVYLTGFMGAGKSSVGRRLAELTGTAFLDLDDEIEARAGMTIREIFERRGEACFRDLEHLQLEATEALGDVVVATGGGTITFERNLASMRRLGVSVWLEVGFELLVERVGARGKEKRPLFVSEDEARELYRRRLPAYRKADVAVTVGRGETPRGVAERIQQILRERRCVI